MKCWLERKAKDRRQRHANIARDQIPRDQNPIDLRRRLIKLRAKGVFGQGTLCDWLSLPFSIYLLFKLVYNISQNTQNITERALNFRRYTSLTPTLLDRVDCEDSSHITSIAPDTLLKKGLNNAVKILQGDCTGLDQELVGTRGKKSRLGFFALSGINIMFKQRALKRQRAFH
jgi:hypothetical protein